MKKTHQLIQYLQNVIVYETYHSFYVVGSNLAEDYFKVFKIDRTCDKRTLELSEDTHDYNREEIEELLMMINVGNTTKSSSISNGIVKHYQGHGIVGFIRFLEGYYLILITKRVPIAVLGYHTIYTIDDVIMIYLPNEDRSIRENNFDEQRYIKMFQTVDLRQNFYYSYSYDLTHTLQSNLTEVSTHELDEKDDASTIGYINKPYLKFVWNNFLLEPIRNKINYQWTLNLIHGYLSQSSLNVFGCSIFITLICRRSAKYAGTRFLKRGGTREGYVANEVETEQIVHNSSVSSFRKGLFTSFVHMRGSIPVLWSQDPKQVPKPPIQIDFVDPFHTLAANHFKQLLKRHGAPMILLNLVKTREKKPQESLLADEYKSAIDYLRQFLPHEHYFQYICFDMAKLNKMEKGNVMNLLYETAENCVAQTGIFKNFSGYHERFPHTRQLGIVRVNCVDCLDRTNTAMYVIGKCALAHQLYALGIISAPLLDNDGICEKMLIDLYEKSGDAIAQQYAGSQLVHRVDTYNRNSIASQLRDNVHTISRYYSNAFSDADKQNALNIFLGTYEPYLMHASAPIWDLTTDIYLHDKTLSEPWKLSKRYCEWIDSKTFDYLPKAINDQKVHERVELLKQGDPHIDHFDNFYKPHKLSIFHEIYYFNILQVNRISTGQVSSSLTSGLKAMFFDPLRRVSKANVGTNSSQSNVQSNASEDSDNNNNNTDDSSFVSPSSQQFLQSALKKVNLDDRRLQNIDNSKELCSLRQSNRSALIYQNYIDQKINSNDFSHLIKKLDNHLEEIVVPKIAPKSTKLYSLHLTIGANGSNAPSAESIKKYENYLKLK